MLYNVLSNMFLKYYLTTFRKVNFCPTCASPVKLKPIPVVEEAFLQSLSNNTFLLGQSIFILRLLLDGDVVGIVHIRPVSTGNQNFIKRLGEFCFQSPKYFPSPIKKVTSFLLFFENLCKLFLNFHQAVPRTYVTFCMNNNEEFVIDKELNVSVENPSDEDSSSNESLSATKPTEIGIYFDSPDKHGNYKNWGLFFPLEMYPPLDSNSHFIPNILFGHVIDHQMLKAITGISKTVKCDRLFYQLSLETR